MADEAQEAPTRRSISPGAEEILGRYFPVLDHGFVALVDYMGSDEDIVRAARVSYGYGTRQRSQTRNSRRYSGTTCDGNPCCNCPAICFQ